MWVLEEDEHEIGPNNMHEPLPVPLPLGSEHNDPADSQEEGGEAESLSPAAQSTLARTLGSLLSQSPGDWSGRQWQRAKGRQLDQTLITRTERALVAQWEQMDEETQSLWTLNCFIYAGKTYPHL